jgi:hypothetical protein
MIDLVTVSPDTTAMDCWTTITGLFSLTIVVGLFVGVTGQLSHNQSV